MMFRGRLISSRGSVKSTLSFSLLLSTAYALPEILQRQFSPEDPFAIIDKQEWVNPSDMTWDDFKQVPGTDWANPALRGTIRNFNIALITVDYKDQPFAVTLAPNSTVFQNPQQSANKIPRVDVPKFYRDFLNKPIELNHGHTLHEYWMGDSGGRYGVDLTAFGAYQLPSLSWQYGLSNDMNSGECFAGYRCNLNIRTDAIGAWKAQIGDAEAAKYELVFILSAGQDESSTWQEFGEMKFLSPDDVTDAFGPPDQYATNKTRNWAKTRYVPWTSWASAASIWPNAGGGSSTQGESSGMGTYAHELSHLLNIGDNYNNPFNKPDRRAYSGPWSMMDRGNFNGPKGPHTRWMIPPTDGGSMGPYHTLRDKLQIGLLSNTSSLELDREALIDSGLVVAEITARSVVPKEGELIGFRVAMDRDRSPYCNTTLDYACDGGGYTSYELEVVDRMGADSFTPDSGVMISKSNKAFSFYQWVIDANPQDIGILDFIRPDGTPKYVTPGDYRQLADALFHAGTRSGSQSEHVDRPNGLHFYVLSVKRDELGILRYTTGVRAINNSRDPHTRGVALGNGTAITAGNTPTARGVSCTFKLTNTGSFVTPKGRPHLEDVSQYLKSDIYRLRASVQGQGWSVILPNLFATAKFGEEVTVNVAVAASQSASASGVVTLRASSESDPGVTTTATCTVAKA